MTMQERFENLAVAEWADCGPVGDWDHVAACMYAAAQMAKVGTDIASDAWTLRNVASSHLHNNYRYQAGGA